MCLAKNRWNGRTSLLLVLVAWGASIGIHACSRPISDSSPTLTNTDVDAPGSGALTFTANGEDLVRQGLLSKDQWKISFDHVYVTFDQLVATQQSESGSSPQQLRGASDNQSVRWNGSKTVDLAVVENPVISTISAPAGRYQKLSWQMSPAKQGPAQGASILLEGEAQKQGQSLKFALKLDPKLSFHCGAYVGDARKGILNPKETTELEATFHFDHLFGDGHASRDDEVNQNSLGFAPIARVSESQALPIEMESLLSQLSTEESANLMDSLASLGHVGEGHCKAKLS